MLKAVVPKVVGHNPAVREALVPASCRGRESSGSTMISRTILLLGMIGGLSAYQPPASESCGWSGGPGRLCQGSGEPFSVFITKLEVLILFYMFGGPGGSEEASLDCPLNPQDTEGQK